MQHHFTSTVGPAYQFITWRLWVQFSLCPAEHQPVSMFLKNKKKKMEQKNK